MGDYWAQLGGSRILNVTRVDQSGADDGNVTDWVKSNPIIVAVRIHSNDKDTAASQYTLRWRDVTDSGVFAALASTGKCKFGDTVLINGTALTEVNSRCSSQGYTWQNGEEVEGVATSDSIDLGDPYETEIQFSVSLADGDGLHNYEFEIYDETQNASLGTLGCTITLSSGLTSVYSDLTALFDVFSPVHPDLKMIFDISNIVQSDLSILFDVRNLVQSDLTAAYDVAARINSDLTVIYDQEGKVSSDLCVFFDILSLVNSDLAAPFDILNTVNSDSTLVYDIQSLVQSDLTGVFDIFKKVQGDGQMIFDISNTVQSDMSILFDVLNTVNSDSTLVYNILGLVQSDLAAIYDIFGNTPSDLTMIYDVFGTSPEGQPVQKLLKLLIANRRRNSNYARANNRI